MEFGTEVRRRAVKRSAIYTDTRFHTYTIGVALIVIIAIQSDKTIFNKKNKSAAKNGVGGRGDDGKSVQKKGRMKSKISVKEKYFCNKDDSTSYDCLAVGGGSGNSGGDGDSDDERIA